MLAELRITHHDSMQAVPCCHWTIPPHNGQLANGFIIQDSRLFDIISTRKCKGERNSCYSAFNVMKKRKKKIRKKSLPQCIEFPGNTMTECRINRCSYRANAAQANNKLQSHSEAECNIKSPSSRQGEGLNIFIAA